MVKVLGINGSGWLSVSHDASVTLVEDGKIICCIEEERLIRKKKAYDEIPFNSIKYCLDKAKFSLDEIDYIVFSWNWKLLKEVKEVKQFDDKNYIINKFFPKKFFSYKRFPKIVFLEHHKAHALSSYLCSGFKESTIITIDGQGEKESLVIWSGKDGKISKNFSLPVPKSFGFFSRH